MAPSAVLATRDVGGTISGVQDSFSSWDSCMSKAYCKWPVIVGIGIGAVIIFSILWCCGRCLCCGAECCCSCLSCCNSCCPGPRKGHRRAESPPPGVFSNQQYQSAPPMYSGPGWNQSNVPQYATFDVSSGDKKINEDALPAMPTWETSKNTKVEMHEEQAKERFDDVELRNLDMKPGDYAPRPLAPPADSRMPIQPRPVHPANASFTNGDFRSPSPYANENYNNGYTHDAYTHDRTQQGYAMPRYATPSPYHDDSNQAYHYANDPYAQHTDYGHGRIFETYAPSRSPIGYASSGATRFDPHMHDPYQGAYQQQPQQPPPRSMPPIQRAATASPWDRVGGRRNMNTPF